MTKYIFNVCLLCIHILIIIPDYALIAGSKESTDRKYVLQTVSNCSDAVNILQKELEGYLPTTSTATPTKTQPTETITTETQPTETAATKTQPTETTITETTTATKTTTTDGGSGPLQIRPKPHQKGKLREIPAYKELFDLGKKWAEDVNNILIDIDTILIDINEDTSNITNGDRLSDATADLEDLRKERHPKPLKETVMYLQDHAEKTQRHLSITENAIDDKIQQSKIILGLTIVSSILSLIVILGIILLCMKLWEKDKQNLLEMEVKEHDTPHPERREIPIDEYMSYNDRFRTPNQPLPRLEVVGQTNKAPSSRY